MLLQGKSNTQLIAELEMEIDFLKGKLKRTEGKLTTREMELIKERNNHAETEMWKRVYQERYLHHLAQCEDLATINSALKRKNSNLESANTLLKQTNAMLESTVKAFKVMIINIKRKEMI